MAIPTSPEAKKMMLDQFKKSLEPIWPNLTKRQTRMEFAARRRTAMWAEFFQQV